MAEYASQVMMCTGLQGSGKTLSTIVRVKAWAESTGRKVYYARIKELALDWEPLEDPDRWYEVPDGSIVVIDEAQQGAFDKAWKPAKGALKVVGGTDETNQGASAVSPAVKALETLRHRGINLVLITQHPMLLHPNVRRLCGLHFHVARTFGMQKAVIHEWREVKAEPEKAKGSSIKHVFAYPKWAFSLYKSAEVHTIKRRIPMKVKLLALLPLVLIGLGYVIYQKVFVNGLTTKPAATVQSATGPSTAAGVQGRPVVGKTPLEYAQERMPRIAGLPATAPVYDKLMEPKVAPKPVACVASPTRCSCYTQQGTKIPDMREPTCRAIVENGYFDDAPDMKQPGREPYFARQARSAELVEAPGMPSVVGADGGPSGGSARAYGSAPKAWVADANYRQTVTQPRSQR